MRTFILALSFGVLGLSLSPANAAPAAKPGGAAKPQHLTIGTVKIPHEEVHEVHAHLSDMKVAMQRRIAGFTFQKIVKGDYQGEYVLEKNHKVTAFLDPSDTMHPRYAQRGEDWAHGGAEKIAPQKRIKLLVTPNKLHEHIGSNLEDEVSMGDLEVALDTMKEAHRIAAQLGIKNAKIYINNQNTASIGQLHVHVLGERPAGFQYPKALSAP